MDLKGIEVYRFTLQANTLAAPTDNPDNQCFCRDPVVTRNCTVAGALDISSCQDGQFAFVIQNYQEVKASQNFLLLFYHSTYQLSILSCLFFLAI